MDTRISGSGPVEWSAFGGPVVQVVDRNIDVVTSDTWVFVAAVYEASINLVTLHVDNNVVVQAGSANHGAGLATTFIGTNPGFGEFFSGYNDKVFFFDQALSINAVQAIAVNGMQFSAAPVPAPLMLVLILIGLMGNVVRRHRNSH
jgi:hypothetical protein